MREIGILKSPRSIVRLDRDNNRLSISSRKHGIEFFGGLYMVISVKGSISINKRADESACIESIVN